MMAWSWVSVLSSPPRPCPLSTSGWARDLAMLSDVVSWENGYEYVNQGTTCSPSYQLVHEATGPYNTRMRVWTGFDETTVIVFRPTQPDGGEIHAQRRLVPCQLFDGCVGRVHDRFQQAFLSLTSDTAFEDLLLQKNHSIFTAGHSLGGALQLFMGVVLSQRYNRRPTMMLGLAGPFVGDKDFASAYYPHSGRGWQVEAVNADNPQEFDGTVEGYTAEGLYIDVDIVCGIDVPKLPDSYGMHDLRNYILFFLGIDCS